MDPHQSVHLGNNLQVVGDLVPAVQRPIFSGLVGNLEQPVDLGLVDADLASNRCQPLIRGVSRLADHVGVEKVLLLLEQLAAKGPELVRGEPQHREPRFVHQRRRGVPRLDLLAEDEGQVGGPGLVVADGGDDVVA